MTFFIHKNIRQQEKAKDDEQERNGRDVQRLLQVQYQLDFIIETT